MINSCLDLFTVTALLRLPFSRSYEVILPSSLTMVLSLVLGFSPRLPVSVCGTGTVYLVSSFSRQREFISFVSFNSPSQPSLSMCVLYCTSASLLGRALPSTRSDYPSVSLLPQTIYWWCRNLYLLVIAYGSTALGLVPDLP